MNPGFFPVTSVFEIVNAQVMSMISIDSVDQARAFYVDKLGFDHMMGMLGKDGQLDFCTVTLNGAKVMLTRPQERTEGTSQR